MSQATFETRIGPDGRLSLLVPDNVASANEDVIVTVQLKAVAMKEREERLKRISAFHGSIDDPEFKRHPQGDLRDLGTID